MPLSGRSDPGENSDRSPLVDVARGEGVATLSLNSHPLNIFGWDLIEATRSALADLHVGGLRAVVLRSGIDGVFSAGVDVAIHTKELAPRMLRRFHRLVEGLRSTDAVVVAAVDGVCLGGAFELVLACDIVVAGPRASFAFPEIDLACFPPAAAALLARHAPRVAADLILTGRRIGSKEAVSLGLVSRAVDSKVDEAAGSLAAEIAGRSRPAVSAAKRALREAGRGPFGRALRRAERIYEREVLGSDDAGEGVAAFLEKRDPIWRHR